MIRFLSRLGVCGAVALVLAAATAATTPPVARSIDQTKGHSGFCENGAGVTVVVDFQQLGGTTIVRCNPQTTRGTGLDALKGAGFQIAGVQRWGEAFVCRIENRPSATEELPVDGGYRESCVDTPPARAYWSYWHAGNNCQWEYSQWGVKNRDFIPGGFEGWSFSLDATADSNPKPRIAAVRPGTEDQPCVAPDEPKPSSGDPNMRQPGAAAPDTGHNPGDTDGAGSPSSGAPASTGAGDLVLPPPKPRESAKQAADDPAGNVAYTGGENAQDVTEIVKEQSGASDWAPWAAAGAVVVLGAATWLTARRRKRARES